MGGSKARVLKKRGVAFLWNAMPLFFLLPERAGVKNMKSTVRIAPAKSILVD
jgi:hypothetical protein